MAKIIVQRIEGALADRRSIYRVFIDSIQRGTLAHCETGSFEVPFGTHTIKLCIDSYSSAPIKVAVLGTIRVICRPSILHAIGLTSMIPASSWISIREEPDAQAAA